MKIAMGTDVGTPGNHCGDNMQEVTLMVEKCGFSPINAIRCATRNDAELPEQPRLGEIAEGKIADVVAVTANPLNDINALFDVGFVIKEG